MELYHLDSHDVRSVRYCSNVIMMHFMVYLPMDMELMSILFFHSIYGYMRLHHGDSQ